MATDDLILVVGATGTLGSEICRRLAVEGHRLRACVRPSSDPQLVAELDRLGAELCKADLKDATSLGPLCEGARVVVSTAESVLRESDDTIEAVDDRGHRDLVDAAVRAGADHFVFVSHSGNILELDAPFERAKLAVEHHLRSSGLAHTILRASFFMEVWLGPAIGFDYPKRRVTVYGDGESPISWISLLDVADFAVRSIGNPAARDAVLELGGPQALSPNAVVRIFEEEAGEPFAVDRVPVETLERQWREATDSLAASFAALQVGYARGDAIDMAPALARVPANLISVRDYARRALADA
jgi:NADH dehydrogenase